MGIVYLSNTYEDKTQFDFLESFMQQDVLQTILNIGCQSAEICYNICGAAVGNRKSAGHNK